MLVLRYLGVIRWFCFTGLGLASLGLSAQRGGLEIDPEQGLVVRPPEIQQEWFRLERSKNLVDWEIGQDTVAWPAIVAVQRPGIEWEFYRFVSIPIPEGPYLVGVVGDSTAVGIQRFPLVGGWAQGLSRFQGEDTRFVMAGEPGLSTKSFFNSFRESMLTRTTPTVVMVQLGQIDEFNGQPEIKGTTIAEYRENLKGIVSFVRGWGGIPILVSPLPSRAMTADGVLVPYLAERSAAVRELGRDVGAYVIDLNGLVSDLYQTSAIEDLIIWGYADDYHLSIPGSIRVAEVVLEALPAHLRELLFVETPSE